MHSYAPVDLTPTTADPTTWGLRNAHDPTVVQAPDGTYVMYCTDAYASGPAPAGVHMRTSADLINWEWAGTAFEGVPTEAKEWTGAPGLWATEVVRWSTAGATDRWLMYYSASTFGSRTSAIGLASAPHPLGPWEPGPLVVKSLHSATADHPETTQNAIDAAISWDGAGIPWLTYGSFFSGLYTIELDPVTGEPATPGDLGTRIASRPRSVEGALEGAYIVAKPDGNHERHVGFFSYDSLVNTYDVRVAHAPRVTGPYTDREGAPMIASELDGAALTEYPDWHGTLVLAGHHFDGQEPLIAPGHNSVLSTLDGDFMVHHVRFGNAIGEHSAQIRRMFWLDSGWPVVSPMPYRGEPRSFDQDLACSAASGTWQVVDFRNIPDLLPAAHDREAPCTRSRTLECSESLTEFGLVEGAVFNVVLPLADGDATVSAFSGYAQDGVSGKLTAVFGIKV